MPRRPVDNFVLARWREVPAAAVLAALADHAVEDRTFKPLSSKDTSRWHASAGGHDFELLCTGPRFFDTRAQKGGGGAVDLAMHLLSIDFRAAAKVLAEKGL